MSISLNKHFSERKNISLNILYLFKYNAFWSTKQRYILTLLGKKSMKQSVFSLHNSLGVTFSVTVTLIGNENSNQGSNP